MSRRYEPAAVYISFHFLLLLAADGFLLTSYKVGTFLFSMADQLQPVIFCVSPAESYARLQTISSSILFHLKM